MEVPCSILLPPFFLGHLSYVCVFWFYCRLVMSAEDRIKELDLEAVNFAKAVKGKIPLGNVFQNISVESEMFC